MFLNLKMMNGSTEPSDPADLPQIIQDPVDTIVDEFEISQMTVQATSGDGSTLAYQWQVNFREHPESSDIWQNVQDTVLFDQLTGWDTDTLDFLQATRVEDANYRVRVSNDTGRVTSDEAKLDVIQDPFFFGTIFGGIGGQNFGYRSDFNGQSEFGLFFGLPENTLLSGCWWNLTSNALIIETKDYEQNGDSITIDFAGFGEVVATWSESQTRYRYDYATDGPMDIWIRDIADSSFPFIFVNAEFGEVIPEETNTMIIGSNSSSGFAGYQRGTRGTLTPDNYQFLGTNNSSVIVIRPDLGYDIPEDAYARLRFREGDIPIQNTITIPRHDNVDFRDGNNSTINTWLRDNHDREVSVYCECFDADGNIIFPSSINSPEITEQSQSQTVTEGEESAYENIPTEWSSRSELKKYALDNHDVQLDARKSIPNMLSDLKKQL